MRYHRIDGTERSIAINTHTSPSGRAGAPQGTSWHGRFLSLSSFTVIPSNVGGVAEEVVHIHLSSRSSTLARRGVASRGFSPPLLWAVSSNGLTRGDSAGAQISKTYRDVSGRSDRRRHAPGIAQIVARHCSLHVNNFLTTYGLAPSQLPDDASGMTVMVLPGETSCKRCGSSRCSE